jgi:hypothetical protein
MLEAVGTPATAALQATSSFFNVMLFQESNKKYEILAFDDLNIKS